MGFLSLIPIKDWLYAGAIVVLLIAFAGFTHHERVVGEQKIEAADAKLAAAQVKHDMDVQNAAAGAAKDAVDEYKATLLKPVDVPVTLSRIVCYAPAPAGGAVPGVAGASGGSDGAPALPTEAGQGFDPASAVLTDGRDADAQITLLQELIRSYQAAGVVAK